MTDLNKEETQNERPRCCRGKGRLALIPFFIVGVVLIRAAIALVVWNALIPALFHGPVLNFLQAVELVILAKVLIGGGFKRGHGHFGPPWRRWEGMSPEEREKLKQAFRNRCG